ncbi:PREDICTED: PAB-dependent poly(A)-specific ribonuclease subunit PAN2 [Ceratosolen solmsi marchali]|uniref:PAB-dependent poly(A)-specific ribonuclease subunit PAN2 n=1 Tax=Ceratosolen solmsi marchali TaxID=326594 RepID=A0AAJ6YHP9_9HYME|nr:PREDICTED: PAB-dependent poly(A)-specific ribonuclease subunit PAN2 [Ceratosolen solmsi marchali]
MEYSAVNEYSSAVQESDLVACNLEENLLWNNADYNITSENFIADESSVLNAEQFSEQFAGIEFRETRNELTDSSGNGFGVSTINFDAFEEIIWTGNLGGHITSYYGPILQKYTSFQVHPKQQVRQIRSIDNGIIALTENTLRFQNRRGLPIYTYSSDNMIDMQCLLCYSSTSILMGGHQEKIIDFDLTTNKEKRLVDIGESGCAMLRQHNRFVCTGNAYGRIEFKDPVSLTTEHVLDTHSGSLSDFDIQGNYLITCGFSNSRQGLSVDRFLMVYDLRQMKAINPLQTLVYPLLLKFLPSFSSRVVVVSPLGQMQVLDTIYANAQPSLTCLYQVATAGAMITSLDVSPTSQCLCFGDSVGSIFLMTSNVPEPQFNTFSRPTEFVDPEEIIQPIDIEDINAPLSMLPMMYNANTLLSDWPEEYSKKVYRKTPAINAEILQMMKMQGSIGYAPNPRPHRRRQKKKLLVS